jgi:hypothetical protein
LVCTGTCVDEWERPRRRRDGPWMIWRCCKRMPPSSGSSGSGSSVYGWNVAGSRLRLRSGVAGDVGEGVSGSGMLRGSPPASVDESVHVHASQGEQTHLANPAFSAASSPSMPRSRSYCPRSAATPSSPSPSADPASEASWRAVTPVRSVRRLATICARWRAGWVDWRRWRSRRRESVAVVRDVSLGSEGMANRQVEGERYQSRHVIILYTKYSQAAFTPPHATFCPLLLGAPSPLVFLSPSLPCTFAGTDADPGSGDARNPSSTRAACSEFRINHPA